ncbi:hypothetical protein ABTZ03_41125 [Kitasatospora sp. NPDC096077]|uniref:hypothetical protein n=1 Tax=Kitasatospora sp. NPDC096077 TaxID=3155544 RepID=UPI003330E1F6
MGDALGAVAESQQCFCVVAGAVIGAGMGAGDYWGKTRFGNDGGWSRRDLYVNMGWFSFGGAAGGFWGAGRGAMSFFRGSGARRGAWRW